MNDAVLFVQNRTHRAGAQTCLARLLRHETLARWKPVLLCSPGGWLVAECRSRGIPVIEERFPSSRSLPARLFGNVAFAWRVMRALAGRSLRPAIVHANDHMEGLLGLELAARLHARTAIVLRSSMMTREDYLKYRCNRYDFIAAVGDEFRDRIQAWEPAREITLVSDGLYADEIGPPRQKASASPRRVLVIGSPLDAKGWADVTEALHLLEREGVLPEMQFDFTGAAPDPAKNDLKIGRLGTARCRFLGRVEAFRDLVLGYDLVINPSRMESFGMAAMEVVAAGVPLLSSRTGVIERVLEQPAVLFPPARPDLLAGALKHVLRHWTEIDFGVAQGQANIRAHFLIDQAAAKLDEAYQRLLGRN